MKLKIKNQENFWSGLMFLGLGIITVVIARDYRMGSAARMGPGYFPIYLGIIMMILGAIITFTSLKTDGRGVKPFGDLPTMLYAKAYGSRGFYSFR